MVTSVLSLGFFESPILLSINTKSFRFLWLLPLLMALPPYDPNFTLAFSYGRRDNVFENDPEHDESASAAIVAVELISSARLALKLDSVRTEYSAQYLVDKAGSRNLRRRRKLTVKDCLNFALKKGGIPRAEDWPPLGSESKTPSSYEPALVSMKGEVIEPKDMDEVPELLVHQSAVGAKLHVFTPHIELQQDAIYLPRQVSMRATLDLEMG